MGWWGRRDGNHPVPRWSLEKLLRPVAVSGSADEKSQFYGGADGSRAVFLGDSFSFGLFQSLRGPSDGAGPSFLRSGLMERCRKMADPSRRSAAVDHLWAACDRVGVLL